MRCPNPISSAASWSAARVSRGTTLSHTWTGGEEEKDSRRGDDGATERELTDPGQSRLGAAETTKATEARILMLAADSALTKAGGRVCCKDRTEMETSVGRSTFYVFSFESFQELR
mmetsp:Transcript_633/g.1929  ORF Transcript_633/g.1929 Transcript_633/m.1929 type:complete len:116 (-) Transcript_633:100-447(-)